MNYKYYKVELMNNSFKEDFYKSIKEKKYKLISNEEFNNIKMEFYKKNKALTNEMYAMYVEATEIDEDSLDLIINYYLKKNVKINHGEYECYNIFVILNIENCEKSVCLSDFIKYGVLTPKLNGKRAIGINQLPLVYDQKDNILYVGFYPNDDYDKRRFCKSLFSYIYEYYDDYYRKYNLDIDDYIFEKKYKGKRFVEGIYPKKNIYTEYSDAIGKEKLNKKIINGLLPFTLLIIFIYISCVNNNLLSALKFIIFLTIIIIIGKIMYKLSANTEESHKSYKKIKLVEKDFFNIVDNLKKSLENNEYKEIDNNVFTNKNKNFIFIEEYNSNTIEIKENSCLIIDSYKTYKRLNLENENLKERNIIALVYDDNMLYVFNRSNEKMLKELYNIIKQIYTL